MRSVLQISINHKYKCCLPNNEDVESESDKMQNLVKL